MRSIEWFFEESIEERMDEAKFKCEIFKMTSLMDGLFPNLEMKYAETVSEGKPHETVFHLRNNNVCTTTVYVFNKIEDKERFATELNLISNSNIKLWK